MTDMFERFTQEAREAVTRAHFVTRETRAPFIEAGHLLVGLVDGEAGRAELVVLDVEVDALRHQILERLERGAPSTGSPPFSPVAKKALELSLREALMVGSNSITPLHLLRGLVRSGDPVIKEVLAEHDVTLDRLVGGFAVEPGPGARRGRTSRRFRRSASAPGMGPWFGPGINHLLSGLVAKERPRRGSHDLLLAMADDERTMAGRLLKDLGVTREML